MKKKAIRLNCDTKTAYYVDIDLSTYEIMEESIRQELNTKKTILHYLPNGEIIFADNEHSSIKIVEKESNIFLGNAVIVSNIIEDVEFPIMYVRDLLLPNVYQFSDEIQERLDEEIRLDMEEKA